MDANYQQAMIAQLMGSQNAAPGMAGQTASTPYGAAFMTGNQMMPQMFSQNGQQGQQQGQQPGAIQPTQTAAGMMNYPISSGV